MQPTVLVVDDEPDNAEYLQRALRGRFEVLRAHSGAEALELMAENNEVAVIVSDQRMPEMNGVQFLQQALEQSPQTVRIILTGFADLDSTIDAINLSQVQGYLRKPIDPSELVSAVAQGAEMYRLRRHNRQLLLKLEDRNRDLEEKERLLRLSLDEKTTELLAANERLETLAERDGLTGLYNHRYLQERTLQEVHRAARYDSPLSLAFIDIDNFKLYNDAHGHPQGDTALRVLSKIFSEGARSVDVIFRLRSSDIVARYGGEEFVILLPETAKEGTTIAMERLRQVVEATEFDGENVLPGGRLTISIGIASFPGDAKTREELIAAADVALYSAKERGRNRVELYGAAPPADK